MNPSIGPSSLESKWVRFSNAESQTKNKADSSALFLPNHASNVIVESKGSPQGCRTLATVRNQEGSRGKRTLGWLGTHRLRRALAACSRPGLPMLKLAVRSCPFRFAFFGRRCVIMGYAHQRSNIAKREFVGD